MYKYPIALTQQFRFCGNPFRLDTYKSCDFGCVYCFANSRNGNHTNSEDLADITVVEKLFKTAYSEKESKNINVELIRNRVPLHCGGMSDPFQHREWNYKNTYKTIKLLNKYNYPIMFSTKTAYLPSEYFDILKPEIHSFQISLVSMDENYIKTIEPNCYNPEERVEFIKLLKSKGFYVTVRIQPLINIDHAVDVVNNVKDWVDYITVEHLKIPTDNVKIKELLFSMINPDDYEYVGRRNYELKKEIKIKNIKKLKELFNPIGVGDNNLNYMSDTNNCCGLDLKYDSWLKYNSMYLSKNNNNDVWIPKCSCRNVFSSDMRGDCITIKDYVDEYIDKDKNNY